MVAAIEQARADDGRVLVLTTSYGLTDQLDEKLENVTAHRSWEFLSALLRRFDADTLISPAAWEGLDLPVSWSDIVIPRVRT